MAPTAAFRRMTAAEKSELARAVLAACILLAREHGDDTGLQPAGHGGACRPLHDLADGMGFQS